MKTVEKNPKKNIRKTKFKSNKKKKSKIYCIMEDILKFYNSNLRKKHIIVYIISLIIFFVFLAMFISSIDVTHSIEEIVESTENSQSIISIILKQTIPSTFLIIFAGITPFIYLSFIGFAYPYMLAKDIASTFLVNAHAYNVILMTFGDIIKIFGISLAMVMGFYYCSLSSKKFRYSQRSGFGMYDLKKHMYELRKDEEKLNKLNEEKLKKDEKNEKLNVKVPYFMIFKIFVIASIISIIGTLVAAI